MLVLSRKPGEQVVIGGVTVIISVVKVREERVTLGIEAPEQVRVLRGELGRRREKPAAGDKSAGLKFV
jgi:carbon storage regulator